MKNSLPSVLFGLLTVPLSYLAVAHALNGGLLLSVPNMKLSIVAGLIFGALICLVTRLLFTSKKPVMQKAGWIVGCVAEVLAYSAIYLAVAFTASC